MKGQSRRQTIDKSPHGHALSRTSSGIRKDSSTLGSVPEVSLGRSTSMNRFRTIAQGIVHLGVFKHNNAPKRAARRWKKSILAVIFCSLMCKFLKRYTPLTASERALIRKKYEEVQGVATLAEFGQLLRQLGHCITDDEAERILEWASVPLTGKILPFHKLIRIMTELKRRHTEQSRVSDTREAFAALGGGRDGLGTVSVHKLREVFSDFSINMDLSQDHGISTVNYHEFYSLLTQNDGLMQLLMARTGDSTDGLMPDADEAELHPVPSYLLNDDGMLEEDEESTGLMVSPRTAPLHRKSIHPLHQHHAPVLGVDAVAARINEELGRMHLPRCPVSLRPLAHVDGSLRRKVFPDYGGVRWTTDAVLEKVKEQTMADMKEAWVGTASSGRKGVSKNVMFAGAVPLGRSASRCGVVDPRMSTRLTTTQPIPPRCQSDPLTRTIPISERMPPWKKPKGNPLEVVLGKKYARTKPTHVHKLSSPSFALTVDQRTEILQRYSTSIPTTTKVSSTLSMLAQKALTALPPLPAHQEVRQPRGRLIGDGAPELPSMQAWELPQVHRTQFVHE